jgi:hypothetical protein
MSDLQPERRTFATPEEEAEEASRALPEQIARLRAEIRTARAKLNPTAREKARDQDSASEKA